VTLAAIAAADERLDATLAAMTDAEAAAPSRLPGWTRAMVATHVARNADSNAAMVAAALRGEERPQYPGGRAERAAGIEAGRGRTAASVRADCRAAAARWHEVMATVRDEQWSLTVPAGVGPRPVAQRVRSRLLEVEVHHADLGLAYTFRDWPLDFAEDQLERRVAGMGGAPGLPGRWRVGGRVVEVAGGGAEGAVDGDPRGLLAWLLGREDVAAAGLVVTGDERVTALPEWWPFP
jgi:maleylpyruvate isomerase